MPALDVSMDAAETLNDCTSGVTLCSEVDYISFHSVMRCSLRDELSALNAFRSLSAFRCSRAGSCSDRRATHTHHCGLLRKAPIRIRDMRKDSGGTRTAEYARGTRGTERVAPLLAQSTPSAPHMMVRAHTARSADSIPFFAVFSSSRGELCTQSTPPRRGLS